MKSLGRFQSFLKLSPACFALLLIFLSSCGPIPHPQLGWILSGRRPPVMTGMVSPVIDYGIDLEEDEEDEEDEDNSCENEQDEKVPLTPENYDPYDPLIKDFRLSEGDLLRISVFGEEETIIEGVPIAPDGRLYYAMADGIPAAGKTIPELSQEIEKALSRYYLSPRLSVALMASSKLSWKILGRMQKPGVFAMNSPTTLRQALGQALGFSTESYKYKDKDSDLEPLADLDHSFMIRNNKKLDVDFQKLIHSADTESDIYLKPGDYIYIASSSFKEIYILGALRSPQRQQYLEDMTLMQALAYSGGWLIGGPYSADVSNCLVIRGDLDNPKVVRCNLNLIAYGEAKDFFLLPGDIIYVHNKPFRFGRALVTLAINTFIQSFATAAGSYYSEFQWFKIPFPDSSDD